jgi:amino acid transporter/mannitol/fructose-specific phosphotransferase system IIA component (Ntr-type)
MDPAMTDAAPDLERRLGLWDVFSIAAGAMISSGLFVLPGLAFEKVGPAMIVCYALAGILNVPTMLAQAELATAMPKSAGSYFVVERSLGAYMGTVAGLINWCSIGLKAAFALVGIGTLGLYFLPDLGPWSAWAVKGAAVAACLLFTIANLVSVRHTGSLQGLLVAGLIVILGAFIGFGVTEVEATRYSNFLVGDLQAFLAVTGMVFISYGGLTKVVDVAEEVEKPARNLPLGMFLSFAVVNLLYVGVAFVCAGALDPALLGGSLRPVTEAAGAVAGRPGLVAVGIAAFLAYASTGNAGILSASRSPMAMSRDGLLPALLSRTNGRFGTPHVSILLTGGLMVLVIAFLTVEDLVKTASTMLLISLALINISVIVMRHSGLEGYRPTYRMPLCPWLPLACTVMYAFLIAEMGLVPLLTTAGFIAAASVWYVAYVQQKIDREAAVAYLVKSILSRHIKRIGLEDELVSISLERDEVEADRFDRLVREAPILDIPEEVSAEELFRRIGEALSERLQQSPERIQELLLARERESSTMIQPGLAIPHVIVEGEEVFELALVRCREGAVFSTLHPPIHTAFVLIGSVDERQYHLRALVAIAHVVQETGFQKRWMAAANAEQLRDIVLLSSRSRE